MSRVPRAIIDEIRDRTDLVELVSRHVRLTRRGNSHVGLCPFHQEKSPSFHVVPNKGIYHCFGCNAGGDCFRFLMEIEGLAFMEAVRELGAAAGVTVEERELGETERRALRHRATLYDVLEAAAATYEAILWARPEGAPGRAYLERRGLGAETARRARLGFAPEGWTTLVDHLGREGFDPTLVVEAGLAREKEGDRGVRRYDAFRGRLMFPIRDERGRVVGFGGRILEGDGPKYVNTPETPLYDKSKVLYGIETARQAMQRKDRAIVVEGYFDVLSLQEAGFDEAVATCGTALTREHLERIRRQASVVYLLFDADDAGARAARRAVTLFHEVGSLRPLRLDLPAGKDPDEFVRSGGAGDLEGLLRQAEPLLEWLVRTRLATMGRDAFSREAALADFLPLLVHAPNALVSKVAAHTDIDEHVVRERIEHLRRHPDAAPASAPAPPPSWRPDREIVHLLWLLVHRYDQVADLLQRADPALLEGHAPVRPVVARLVGGEPAAAILGDLGDEALRKVLAAVVARQDLYPASRAAVALCGVLARLDAPRRAARLAEVSARVEQASRERNAAALRLAVAELTRLQRQERALSQAIRQEDVAGGIALLSRPVTKAPGLPPD